jgi:hypothetical protein
MRKLFHRHVWKMTHKDAVARYVKQEGQGEKSVIFIRGEIQECSCDSMRVVPKESGLKPVEVERENQPIVAGSRS